MGNSGTNPGTAGAPKASTAGGIDLDAMEDAINNQMAKAKAELQKANEEKETALEQEEAINGEVKDMKNQNKKLEQDRDSLEGLITDLGSRARDKRAQEAKLRNND